MSVVSYNCHHKLATQCQDCGFPNYTKSLILVMLPLTAILKGSQELHKQYKKIVTIITNNSLCLIGRFNGIIQSCNPASSEAEFVNFSLDTNIQQGKGKQLCLLKRPAETHPHTNR